jgi:hypothetical protein
MSNTPQLQQDYSQVLNTIVNSNIDKNEKIKMLEVVKQNLQLSRQAKHSNIQQQDYKYLSSFNNPFMMNQQISPFTNSTMQTNPMMYASNPMMYAGNPNYQNLYMYEVINYKLNQLLMNIDKINETMTSVSENTIDDLIKQISSGETETKEENIEEETKNNGILNTVNNILGLNKNDEEEEETEESTNSVPLYSNNNLIKNVSSTGNQANTNQSSANTNQSSANTNQSSANTNQSSANTNQSSANTNQSSANTNNNANIPNISPVNNEESVQANTTQSGGVWSNFLNNLL